MNEFETMAPAPLPLPASVVMPWNGLVPTPPIGWSSWNCFEDRIIDATMRDFADATVSSGMAAAGNDLRSMSRVTLEILTNREAIEVNQDPPGRQGRRVAARDGIEIRTKPIRDGDIAIGIFNRTTHPQYAAFDSSKVGASSAPRRRRDLWAHEDLPVDAARFETSIPTHGVKFLCATLALAAWRCEKAGSLTLLHPGIFHAIHPFLIDTRLRGDGPDRCLRIGEAP